MSALNTRRYSVPSVGVQRTTTFLSSPNIGKNLIGKTQKNAKRRQSTKKYCGGEQQIALEDIQRENERLQAQLADAQEIERLRKENEMLRKVASDQVRHMEQQDRDDFLKQYQEVMEQAVSVGIELPTMQVGELAKQTHAREQHKSEQSSKQEVQEKAVETHEIVEVQHVEEQPPAGSSQQQKVAKRQVKDQFVIEDENTIVQVSVDEEDSMTFTFDNQGKKQDNSESGGKNVVMALQIDDPDDLLDQQDQANKQVATQEPISSSNASTNDKDKIDGKIEILDVQVVQPGSTKIQTNNTNVHQQQQQQQQQPQLKKSDESNAVVQQQEVVEDIQEEEEEPEIVQKEVEEPEQEIEYIDGIPIGVWPKPLPQVLEKGLSPTEKKQLQQQAASMVASTDARQLISQRQDWLWFTIPETPVAGTKCVMYYHRQNSDVLQHRPRIQCHLNYNTWELEGERLQLHRQDFEGDWWSGEFSVPENAYEINFVFSDAEGQYDNNQGQDFLAQVDGGVSREQWILGAPQRLYQEMLVKAEKEEAAAKEAEKQRIAEADKQDLERARWFQSELKQKKEWLLEGAKQTCTYEDGVVAWTTTNLIRGQKGKLRYNSKVGPFHFLEIPEDQHITLRIGTNDWQDSQDVQMTRFMNPQDPSNKHWWEGEFDVPFDALIMSFVVNYYEHWDNNSRRDHKIEISLNTKDVNSWIDSLEEEFYQKEKKLREQKEALHIKKMEKAQRVRQQAQEQAQEVARRQMRFVLFTDPPTLEAGKKVTIYYNPTNTNLNGRDVIFVNGGWNRWTHRENFGPVRMALPGEGGQHFRVTVDIPVDAHTMDFVFSDVPSGDGTYDNRGGLDYHIPIEGSVQQETPLHIVHVSVEMAPICKVGGLADVVTSLGRAVQDQGHIVEVILPKYDFLNSSPMLGSMQYETEFDWGGTKVFVCSCIVEGLRCFFVEPRNSFFQTQSVYGRSDDQMRFEFFCKAALEFLLQTHRHPDILHCHDWSTAQVAKSYWDDYHLYGLWKPRVVFTIHNLNYGQQKIAEAAYYSQFFTTVSPTYAFETGGTPVINPHVGKFRGIRNGIDLDIWDPENDQFLPLPYNFENYLEGKARARQELRQRLGMGGSRDCPVIGVVSRLTAQKGIHLIKHTAWRAIDRGCQFVLLGSAPDPKIQADFKALAGSIQGEHASFCFAYDEPLSHLIYAACDMIVVPSMFEPCGLTQMIAMRYGTIPIVRHTGGLRDTVFDVDNDKARAAWEQYGSTDWQADNVDATNGFAFEGTDSGALDYALNRAIDAWYNDRTWFQALQKRVMQQDWSWNRPAMDYIELYHAARKQ